VEIDSIGFSAPLAHKNLATDSLFDVYVFKIDPSDYGYVSGDSLVGDNPRTKNVVETSAFTSYMALRNSYAGFASHSEIGDIQVTTAHEFFHGIKNGIDAFAKSWMNEATAAWMEDVVYDSVDDNQQYCFRWFNSPDIPLDADNHPPDSVLTYQGHWYGSWIFMAYLSEHVGGALAVRHIWDRVGYYDNYHGKYDFAAIGDALAGYQLTFPQVFMNFAAANAMLIYPPYSYQEGPEINAVAGVGKIYVTKDSLFTDTLNRHALRYYQVFPPAGATTEAFDFTPSDVTTHFKLELVVRNGKEVTVIPFTDHVCLPLTPTPDAIFAVVMNTDSVGGTNKYRLRITQNIQLKKSAPVSVAAGSALTYTLTITNKSATDLHNIVLTDSIPFWAQFQSASDGGDTTGLSVTWRIFSLAAGANKSVTYTVMLTGCSTVYNSSYALTADSIKLICGAPFVTGITPSPGQRYTITDLGGLYSYSTGEPAGSAAHSINNRGEVTGEAYALPNATYPTYAPTHAFLWRNGVMQDIGTFDGPGLGPDSYGSSINDNGQVAGFADVVVGTPPFISYYNHAFIVSGGSSMSDIGFLPTAGQYPYANGFGINNKGQVVGTCADSTITGGTSAFLYSGGSMTRLNALPESYDSVTYAYAINNKGQAVGNSDSAGFSRAVMWDNGGAPQRLGMLPGMYMCGASSINDSGQIVGWCDSLGQLAGTAYLHATLWDHGRIIDLGSLYGSASALAINNKGDIVGYSYPTGTQPQNGQYLDEYGTAFILPHNGRIMKLDSLTPSGCESLNDAIGINDSGQIIAYIYKLNEYKESFLLTPIPSSSGVQYSSASSLPDNPLMLYNYPNPFREQTTVAYSIEEQGSVTVEVVNMLGETVANVYSGRQTAGMHNISVDAARFLPGVYFCKVTLNGKTMVHPMMMVR
jgi:uncharacterized repeat protein (TIGR01451 family)